VTTILDVVRQLGIAEARGMPYAKEKLRGAIVRLKRQETWRLPDPPPKDYRRGEEEE